MQRPRQPGYYQISRRFPQIYYIQRIRRTADFVRLKEFMCRFSMLITSIINCRLKRGSSVFLFRPIEKYIYEKNFKIAGATPVRSDRDEQKSCRKEGSPITNPGTGLVVCLRVLRSSIFPWSEVNRIKPS